MAGRIDRLARRVEPDQRFLAAALAGYARSEHMSDTDLAASLGCPVETLAALRLCLRPRADHFGDDIDEIAARFQLDDVVLAEAVRRADALESMRQPTLPDAGTGLLRAARDRRPRSKPAPSGES
jgi:hypothetical protein